jgi:deoxycytidine triphosphate deaminase
MFGNLINNALIKDLIKRKVLEIVPMDKSLLQLTQYPLRPHILYKVKKEKEGQPIHYFTEKNNEFKLEAKTYYWVDIFEYIKLPVGIVGRFIPSSNLIEKGLGLTAGKIEKPFGDNGEKTRFGIYNYLDTAVTLRFEERIAYVQFTDLRGLDNHKYAQTKYDKETYEFRLHEDDEARHDQEELEEDN